MKHRTLIVVGVLIVLGGWFASRFLEEPEQSPPGDNTTTEDTSKSSVPVVEIPVAESEEQAVAGIFPGVP